MLPEWGGRRLPRPAAGRDTFHLTVLPPQLTALVSGMNKLVVNHLEKIIVTSDCATIVKELEIQHPAARILVLAAEMQEKEFGDQTNFVCSFAILAL